MKKIIRVNLIIFIILIGFGSVNSLALAQSNSAPCTSSGTTQCLEIPLPFIGSSVNGPASYLSGLYKLAVGVAIVLAAVMIVIGGITWSTSGDNAGKKKEAMGQITQAILGLVILLASYLILRTINPSLTNLSALQSTILDQYKAAKIDIKSIPTPIPPSEACLKCLTDASYAASHIEVAEFGAFGGMTVISPAQFEAKKKEIDSKYKQCLAGNQCPQANSGSW